MPTPQKCRERVLLECFFEASGISAKVISEREAPDFIVCLEGREVGVELTDLFISRDKKRNLLRVRESISERIVSHAQRMYEESGGPPVFLSVHFSYGVDLRVLDRIRTASALSTLVRGLGLLPSQHVLWRPDDTDEFPLWDAVSAVHALGLASHHKVYWTVGRAGHVVPLTTPIVQARIDEKARKLREYRKVVSENWLVMVGDGTRPSQLFDVRPGFDPSQVHSPFSRTYYFGFPDRGLLRLGTWLPDS